MHRRIIDIDHQRPMLSARRSAFWPQLYFLSQLEHPLKRLAQDRFC
jgi:hypothetical protein